MNDELIQNRTAFLANLTERLGTPRQAVSEHPFVPISQLPQQQFADKTPDELLEICKERVKQINTTLIETTQAALVSVLAELVVECGGGSVLLPTDERFATYGLSAFASEQSAFSVTRWKEGPEYREENIHAAQNANVAVAFAEFLLAESGSVVVETSAGQGRSLHFLPTHYISIVPMSNIVPRSTQAAAYYSEKIEAGEKIGSAIHFISGPSNSGDIEMQLVVGLHGPLEVYYVVVKDL